MGTGLDNLNQLISACDEQLKAGNLKNAEALLLKLLATDVRRERAAEVAQLCRRARLFEEGLKILSPLVRPESGVGSPTPREVTEYAILLSWIGSHSEALDLLNSVSVADIPEVHLNKAYCYILQWDYSTAALELTNAIEVEKDPYRILIGKVNLVAALISDGLLEKAMILINQNIQAAAKLDAKRLLGNSYQLRAQIWISLGEMVQSRKDLDTANEILKDSTWDQLLVKKWESIHAALVSGQTQSIVDFRAEAMRMELWESAREADYYILRARFDQATFDHLYFGTPFEPYRSRMRLEFMREPKDGYQLGPGTGTVFDPVSGQSEGSITYTNPGSKICQLLQILSLDLYAPPRLGKIFSFLYPKEYFNAYSSPHRIHQLILRAREWNAENNTGFAIRNLNGQYRLTAEGAGSIRISVQKRVVDDMLSAYEKLLAVIPQGQPFTSAEGAKALEMSPSNFTRYIKVMQEKGWIDRAGAARYTRYKLRKAA